MTKYFWLVMRADVGRNDEAEPYRVFRTEIAANECTDVHNAEINDHFMYWVTRVEIGDECHK